MNGRSFISYSVQDAGLASAVYAFLKSNGHAAVKAPDDIALGEDWAASIANLIEHSDYFILLWTHNSMSSKEVAKELTLAMDCGSKIIPFRAEDLSPEGAWRYHLMNVQWLEAHAMPEASALDALLTYFKRTQENNNNFTSSNTKETLSEQSSSNNSSPHNEVDKEITRQANSLALDYAQAGPDILDNSSESKESRPIGATSNDAKRSQSSTISLETLNNLEVQPSVNDHIGQGSWQFSAAVEIACTLGYSTEAASEVHSKRTLFGYRLCDKLGITLALIPLAMIDSKRSSTRSRIFNRTTITRQKRRGRNKIPPQNPLSILYWE